MGFPEDSTIYILVFPTATSHHWQCETGLRIYLFQSTLRNPRVKVSGRHFQLHNLQAILCQSHLWAVMWWLGFPGSSAGKESACNARDRSSIPGSGKSPGEGISYPLQYSCLESPLWTEESGGLQSMRSPRVRYGWVTKHSIASGDC